MPRRSFPVLALLLAWFASIIPCGAAASLQQDPAARVLATVEAVLDLTIGHPPEEIIERVPQIRARMEESFALSAIVQRSFGRNWTRLSRPQQEQVMDMLGRVIISSYAKQLSTAKRPKITLLSSKKVAEQRYELATVATIDGQSVNIVYRLAPIDEQWKVYDVIVENMSVVGNYRQQFDAFFRNNSVEALLDLLRDKVSGAAEKK
jgi:phospholipid transport system substrate-binding protein